MPRTERDRRIVIYPTIVVVLFVIAMALTGTGHWGLVPWWQGVAAGIALALVWHASHRAARFLGLLGAPLLAATAMGWVGQDMAADSHAFFNGMSLAMPLGFAISAWWRWDRFRPRLVFIARIENVQWLLRLLGEQ